MSALLTVLVLAGVVGEGLGWYGKASQSGSPFATVTDGDVTDCSMVLAYYSDDRDGLYVYVSFDGPALLRVSVSGRGGGVNSAQEYAQNGSSRHVFFFPDVAFTSDDEVVLGVVSPVGGVCPVPHGVAP